MAALTQVVINKIQLMKEERMESVFLIQDTDSIAAIVTFSKVPVIQIVSDEYILSCLSIATLWGCFSVNMQIWSKLTGLRLRELKIIFNKLSLNGIIYPDNSVSLMVLQTIRGKAFIEQSAVLIKSRDLRESAKKIETTNSEFK